MNELIAELCRIYVHNGKDSHEFDKVMVKIVALQNGPQDLAPVPGDVPAEGDVAEGDV